MNWEIFPLSLSAQVNYSMLEVNYWTQGTTVSTTRFKNYLTHSNLQQPIDHWAPHCLNSVVSSWQAVPWSYLLAAKFHLLSEGWIVSQREAAREGSKWAEDNRKGITAREGNEETIMHSLEDDNRDKKRKGELGRQRCMAHHHLLTCYLECSRWSKSDKSMLFKHGMGPFKLRHCWLLN